MRWRTIEEALRTAEGRAYIAARYGIKVPDSPTAAQITDAIQRLQRRMHVGLQRDSLN